MKLSFKGYIRYVRRQHVHVQRLHALFFASAICVLLAGGILYTEYGYWHQEYSRESGVTDKNRYIGAVSPLERLSQLISEGRDRLSGIGQSFGSQTSYDRSASTTP